MLPDDNAVALLQPSGVYPAKELYCKVLQTLLKTRIWHGTLPVLAHGGGSSGHAGFPTDTSRGKLSATVKQKDAME
jgi:hypothetical protein